MTKTTSITVRGTVERCELKQRKPFVVSRYSQGETDEFYIDVCLRLEDGSAAYFKTAAATRTVASCPGAAIVHYAINGEAAKWLVESHPEGEERVSVATAGRSNNNSLRARVVVGDRVVVTGRVKAERVSKAGKPYKTLTHVRRA